MQIKPFKALHPPPHLAEKIASPPYDVLSSDECRALVRAEPRSFLRIVRPEVDLDPHIDAGDEAVYEQAGANLRLFRARGWLVEDKAPALFIYRLASRSHTQTGIVALSHVGDYESGRIRKHEHTRARAEADRARHILALRAHTGPVFLTYSDRAPVDEAVAGLQARSPLYDFSDGDGVTHTVWRIEPAADLLDLLRDIPAVYIADGHHRAAAAARVARDLRGGGDPRGELESDWFLTVLFPAGQLRILPYNRLVHDLNGMTAEAFLGVLREHFSVAPAAEEAPERAGSACLYLAGRWHALSWEADRNAGVVAAMDVSVLQQKLLEPLLGIRDPRNDPRLSFVGGSRGTAELRRRVDSGQAAAAFSLYPTSIQQLMTAADQGLALPPKSTWFEPKLRSGLFVHPF